MDLGGEKWINVLMIGMLKMDVHWTKLHSNL